MRARIRRVKARWTHGYVLIFAITLFVCVCHTFSGKSSAEQPPSEKTQKTETNWLSKLSGRIKAQNLSNQVIELYKQGHYADAIPVAEELLELQEKIYGPEHTEVATSLYLLAALYHHLGEYLQAEPLYQRSLTIREKILGPEHPDVVRNLTILAVVYHARGEYAKVEPLLKRALAIGERTLGPEHPDVATILNNLATLYKDLGKYEEAEALFRQVLTIREKILGPEHPDVAITLNNLATLYYFLGNYTRVESLLKRALAIREKAFGPEDYIVIKTINNLAVLYRTLGEYTKAEPLYIQALEIGEKTLGPEHPEVAAILLNLAGLYDYLGEYAKAELFYKRSLAIREKVLGPENSGLAVNLHNLAEFYRIWGEYAKAEPLFTRALAIGEKTLGPEHPDVVTNLHTLATVYAALGKVEEAHNFYKRAQQFDEKLIEQVMGFTSEEQKLRFLTTKKWSLELFLSLTDQHLGQDPSARKDAFDIWLRRKGVILEAQRRFQEVLIYSDNPEAMITFQELARVRAQLSRLVFAGPGKEGPEAYKQRVAELETRKEELEAKLSRLSQAYALKQKIAKADVEKVAKALPANTVLIEFARVKIFNFKAKGREEWWNPAHYLAFVLHAGNRDNVGMIDLGEADTIDKAVAVFKKQITRGRLEKRSFEALETSSEQVYTLVFAPLQEELGEVKEIFISPDGNLNLIPFEVLIGPDGRFLIEDYTFNYLAAGRDILGFGEIQEEGNSPLLMGDPDFDFYPPLAPPKRGITPPYPPQGGEYPDPSQADSRLMRNERRSVDMRGFHFKRLPWTKKEVETIHTLLGENQTALYTDKNALEEVLMQTEAPRILHLATHGFFLEDQDLSEFVRDGLLRASDIYFKSDPQPPFALGPSVPAQFENPLLRSGIALAGANMATGENGQTSGIVTAEKILSLKLRGTEMVVLSACETGLGDVQVGEGVFGLRRAFTQAGAKSLVMSLWKVPDRETKDLMVRFYTHLLSGQKTRVQALREAALEMKKEKPHPYYWGAFVFLGEP